MKMKKMLMTISILGSLTTGSVASANSASRELPVTEQWLWLPVGNQEPEGTLTLYEGENPVKQCQIRLSATPQWFACMDVSAFRGKTLRLVADGMSEACSAALEKICLRDTEPKPLEEEASWRPLIHFTPRRGWNNDPNGLVYFQGEYHLFFQHNPYGVTWGNMHWGHAVSRNLFQWNELGDVLEPDALGAMFSGSAVIDHENTAGFGKGAMVLIYTAAGNPFVQCIAHSMDGRHFTKFDGNPVVPCQTDGNRDPRVFWHEPTRRWIMVFYVQRPGPRHTVEFWGSPNLREWSKLSDVQGQEGAGFLYECPDFFELAVEGRTETRWVLMAANGEYAIGRFDGVRFHMESGPHEGFRGEALYAAQTFNNEPEGRRIILYWLRCAAPSSAPFNQGMSLPHELKLKSTPAGIRLVHEPMLPPNLPLISVTEANQKAEGTSVGEAFACRIHVEDATRFDLRRKGIHATYDPERKEVVVNGKGCPWPLETVGLDMLLIVDRLCVELFSADGLHYGAISLN